MAGRTGQFNGKMAAMFIQPYRLEPLLIDNKYANAEKFYQGKNVDAVLHPPKV